ncbi:hypothetical protein ABK040_013208 [Willaertia magna]
MNPNEATELTIEDPFSNQEFPLDENPNRPLIESHEKTVNFQGISSSDITNNNNNRNQQQSTNNTEQQQIPEEELDTIDEPIIKTISRDLLNIGRKIALVLIPSVQDEQRINKELRNWDLWGPLLLCIILAFTLGFSARSDQKAVVWCCITSTLVLTYSVKRKRKVLSMYPVVLYYVFLGWLVFVQ